MVLDEPDGQWAVTAGTFINPKVGAVSDPVDSWYRYYAGYSAGFVEQALRQLAGPAELVLDPWNGTGTTTVVAASQRFPAIGFDVNPALVVVARARLLGAGVWASIDPLGEDVVSHAASVELDQDPLLFWFTPAAAGSLRGLQHSVHRLLVDPGSVSQPAYHGASGMSTLAAFFYTVLFRTVRVLIAPRGGTNPTWWKQVAEADRLDPSPENIVEQFQASATELAAGLHRDNYDGGVDVQACLGDSRHIALETDSVGGVVTSPPYCTRIDYGDDRRHGVGVGLGHGHVVQLEVRPPVSRGVVHGVASSPAMQRGDAPAEASLVRKRAGGEGDLVERVGDQVGCVAGQAPGDG